MAQQPHKRTGKGGVTLLRELRCVRCGCRSTDGDGFMLADSTVTTIDDVFTFTTDEADTDGTIAAVCSTCAPRIAELLGGIS